MRCRLLIALTIIARLLLSPAHAQVITGDNAVDLLGKYGDSSDLNAPSPRFTKTGSNNAPYYYGLNNPSGFAIDSTRHRLFIADTSNNRIVVFNLTAANALIDHVPDFVLGQPNFASGTAGTTSSLVSAPRALLYDGVYDQLIVADSGNNRILFFDVSNLSSALAASYVLGQADLTSNSSGTSATKFSAPSGLALRPASGVGNNRTLYVSDRANNRVLLFNFAADPTGTVASTVLGQADFTSTATSTPSFQMSLPGGLTLDVAGNRLFVPCFAQHRVMVFDVSSPTDGMTPSRVIGQPDTTTTTSGNTADKLNFPTAVAYDSVRNNLFVSAVGNQRITVFSVGTDFTGITTGQSATNILGQSLFTSTSAQATQSGISFFTGGKQDLFVDSTNGRLYVSQGYHRISIFDVAAVSDGEDAIDLIGQYDGTSLTNPVPSYTRTGVNDSPNNLGLQQPRSVAVDTVHHRLFVADGLNHRVLVFNLDSNNLLIDHVPDYVLGQTDFISNTSGTSASKFDLGSSGSLMYDATNDRLFLACGSQNRILIFDTAAIVNGEAAVRVLGQSDFTSTGSASGSSRLFQPSGMDYDSARKRLFVADDLNQRVLIFTNAGPGDLSDGQAASFVLGQPDFTTVASATTQAKMSRPKDLAYDATNDRLFVCDTNNRRVLVHDVAPSTVTNGQNASNVIGQPDFVSANNSRTQDGMVIPQSLSLDVDGQRLFVADGSANRVMVYDTSSLPVAAEPAIAVVGQIDFTSNASGTTQSNFSTLGWVEYDSLSKRFYAADTGNHRVMFFAADASLVYSTSTFDEASGNDGSISTTATLTLPNSNFAVTSGPLTQGTHYSVSNLPSGLGVSVTATSATSATVSLTGNAVSHENANSISNLTIAFTDSAFSGRTAAQIIGSTKSDLAIHFSNAPTATPTSTPTRTPLPTSTPTQVPTLTPSATSTPLNTPLATSTSTAVTTPTATPDRSPSPTVVPTGTSTFSPIATPTGSEVMARVVVSSKPVNNALVYVMNLGISRTDTDGIFRITGASPGSHYTLLISHPGSLFAMNELAVQTGKYQEIQGESYDYNPRGCTENDISNSLFAIASIADQLHDRIANMATNLPNGAERINRRITRQLNDVFTVSAEVPAVLLRCERIMNCAVRNLREEQKLLLERLADLRHENLLVIRNLRILGKQDTGRSSSNARKIIKMHQRARASVLKLPKSTGVCS